MNTYFSNYFSLNQFVRLKDYLDNVKMIMMFYFIFSFIM